MSAPKDNGVRIHSKYNASMLFLTSCVALTTGGMVFSLRGTVMDDLSVQFLLDKGVIGGAVGAAFLSFALFVFIGSPLCDLLGMGRLLGLAAVLHVVGPATVVFTGEIAGSTSLAPSTVLWAGMFICGIAHGLVEAVINPLIATIYADDKTHKLNVLHAWWPGGLIIGGLLGWFLNNICHASWQIRMAIIVVPAIAYLIMALTTKFPPTERVAASVPAGDMVREAIRPLFFVWFCCMWLTATLELGPGQWVDAILTRTVGFQGILLLVYVSGLMFVLRHFAGTFAHKLSPVGLMWMSSLLAGLGLLALSFASGPVMGLLAATVWGFGVCYMWPTMLGVTSERFPRGGALLMGLMGTAGNLAIYKVLPIMGRIYDQHTQAALPPGVQLDSLLADVQQKVPGAEQMLHEAQTQGAPFAFRYIACLSLVLVVVFGIIWLRDKAAGGYKAEKLETVMEED